MRSKQEKKDGCVKPDYTKIHEINNLLTELIKNERSRYKRDSRQFIYEAIAVQNELCMTNPTTERLIHLTNGLYEVSRKTDVLPETSKTLKAMVYAVMA